MPRALILIAGLAFAAIAAGAAAQTAAQGVLARARQAQGGAAAWNAVRGLKLKGEEDGRPIEMTVDLIRYGLRIEQTGRPDWKVQGYNGFGEWRILVDGQSTGSQAAADLAEIRSDAYFASYGYFFPSRFEAQVSLVGAKQIGGRAFDAVKVEPAGGEPRELWFDRRTGQLAIIVDETGPRQGRTEFSDYRRAGRITVAFKAFTYGGTHPASAEMKVESVDAEAPDRALFSLPRPIGGG